MPVLTAFAKLRSMLFRGAVAVPAPQPCAAEVLARALEAEPGAVLVVGASGSGKSTLLERLHGRARGCCVLLTLSERPLPGWEEAPFHGTFRPADGTQPCDVDLEDVLRSRPIGQFRLEVPSEVMGLRHPRGELVRRGLKTELAKILHAGTDVGVPLSLIVDEARDLLDLGLMTALGRQARSVNCSIVLGAQDVPDDFVVNTRHNVVLRLGDAASVERLGALTGIPTERLRQVPRGHALYKNVKAGGAPVELRI